MRPIVNSEWAHDLDHSSLGSRRIHWWPVVRPEQLRAASRFLGLGGLSMLKYCDADCFTLARECANLMGRVLASSRRPRLTLKTKLEIKTSARARVKGRPK